MEFSNEDIQEFKTEAEELLDGAERGLLALDRGEILKNHYDAIFRAFHSIKGAAGMMEMTQLQKHMHELESILTDLKAQTSLEKKYIEFFLIGADNARNILLGRPVTNKAQAPGNAKAPEPSTQKSSAAAANLVSSTTATQAAQKAAQTKSEPKRGKILVVDDEREIVEFITEILARANFEVHGTSDPKTVMSMVNSVQPDAIMTDLSMPEISGLDLLFLIAKSHPDIPVIFVSGQVSKEVLMEAIEQGVYAIVEKPFEMSQVIECAVNAVKKHKVAKLLNKSINLILYQFSDLDQFLKASGKEDIRLAIKNDLTALVNQWRSLRSNSR